MISPSQLPSLSHLAPYSTWMRRDRYLSKASRSMFNINRRTRTVKVIKMIGCPIEGFHNFLIKAVLCVLETWVSSVQSWPNVLAVPNCIFCNVYWFSICRFMFYFAFLLYSGKQLYPFHKFYWQTIQYMHIVPLFRANNLLLKSNQNDSDFTWLELVQTSHVLMIWFSEIMVILCQGPKTVKCGFL